jgi:CDP-diacylglycerol--glycerol-3-phosphate 3-phosphatidyltransferase
MFPDRLQAFGRKVAFGIVAPLQAIGVTPNQVTVAGLILNAAVAWIIASGHLRLGGVALLVSGAFDMLDGALARRSERATPFGSFLDSTLDRYSEAFVLIGLIYIESQLHHTPVVVLAAVVLTGSFLISYTRARAEGLDLECKVGLLPRPERILLLAAGLIFPILVPVLIILVALTNFTAGQRIVEVWRLTHRTGGDATDGPQANG